MMPANQHFITYQPLVGQEGLDIADSVVHFLNQANNEMAQGRLKEAAENLDSMAHELKLVDWTCNDRNKIQQLAVCSMASLLGLSMALPFKKPDEQAFVLDI